MRGHPFARLLAEVLTPEVKFAKAFADELVPCAVAVQSTVGAIVYVRITRGSSPQGDAPMTEDDRAPLGVLTREVTWSAAPESMADLADLMVKVLDGQPGIARVRTFAEARTTMRESRPLAREVPPAPGVRVEFADGSEIYATVRI